MISLSLLATVLIRVIPFGFGVSSVFLTYLSCCRANFSISRRFPCRNPTRTNFLIYFSTFSSFFGVFGVFDDLLFRRFRQWPLLHLAWLLQRVALSLQLLMLHRATPVARDPGIGGEMGPGLPLGQRETMGTGRLPPSATPQSRCGRLQVLRLLPT